jgi:GNAT superfamily N-acetyltransferase
MLKLRDSQKEDTGLIVEYIKELAAFEQLSHECSASPERIQQWLFSSTPRAYCLLAEWEGKPAGFALYFYNFSTFLSKPGIYIEDVFIRPNCRRKGIARKIFQHLAQKALAEGCGRLEWSVLDWNKDAITLYESIGAMPMNGWLLQRLTGAALEKLAAAK